MTDVAPVTPPSSIALENVPAEYTALRTGAVVIDRSDRGRMRFTGEKAGDVLTGLLTNDVLALHPGHGQYAVALTPRGRVVADVRVFAGTGWYLVDTSARAWPGWAALVQKFVNPRLSAYRDETATLGDVGIFGAQAARVAAQVTGLPPETLAALPPYAHVALPRATSANEQTLIVARTPDLRVDGFDVIAPFEICQSLANAARAAGAADGGPALWEVARIEAGRPEWGVDMDDTTIPQEANLDELGAISYTKGCYTGQEVVARVHFRGHVNRHLRGLRAAGNEVPPAGAQLVDDGGTLVGDVRSVVVSPRLGGIALGYVRREVAPGSSLTAKWDGGERRVDVSLLPFPD